MSRDRRITMLEGQVEPLGKQVLVGSTGLVGQNLLRDHAFDIAVHSSDVSNAFISDCDLVVYAGVPGTKYLANHDPERDIASVESARANLREINADKVVLISTVDVYGDSRGKTENDQPGGPGLTAYGMHRLQLEQWVREDYPDASIVRLPAIYGQGLKKNFVHDMIHPAPPKLDSDRYGELVELSDDVRLCYEDDGNGYYSYSCSDGPAASSRCERSSLDAWFARQSFNALSFTDSRSRFQFFDLGELWDLISKVLREGISLLNVATPPISAGEVYQYIFGQDWSNYLDRQPLDYDMRTIFGQGDEGGRGYLQSHDEELEHIKRFVTEQRSVG